MKPLRSSSRNSSAGFTLIEVLVIVIIIAILAAIAAPSWLAYVNRRRVSAVENGLVQVLRQAQQQAIQERQTIEVTVENSGGFPVADVGGNVQRLGPDDLRADLVELTPDTSSVSFDYKGMVPAQDLPIVFNISPANSTIRQCVIVTNLLGNIKTSRDTAVCDEPI